MSPGFLSVIVSSRIDREGVALSPADLLLTKLQIVQTSGQECFYRRHDASPHPRFYIKSVQGAQQFFQIIGDRPVYSPVFREERKQ